MKNSKVSSSRDLSKSHGTDVPGDVRNVSKSMETGSKLTPSTSPTSQGRVKDSREGARRHFRGFSLSPRHSEPKAKDLFDVLDTHAYRRDQLLIAPSTEQKDSAGKRSPSPQKLAFRNVGYVEGRLRSPGRQRTLEPTRAPAKRSQSSPPTSPLNAREVLKASPALTSSHSPQRQDSADKERGRRKTHKLERTSRRTFNRRSTQMSPLPEAPDTWVRPTDSEIEALLDDLLAELEPMVTGKPSKGGDQPG